MKVSNLLQEINEQLLTMFQFENMISQRTQDFDLLTEKEEQIKELVQAHTWVIKKNLIHQQQKKVEHVAMQALPHAWAQRAGLLMSSNNNSQAMNQ